MHVSPTLHPDGEALKSHSSPASTVPLPHGGAVGDVGVTVVVVLVGARQLSHAGSGWQTSVSLSTSFRPGPAELFFTLPFRLSLAEPWPFFSLIGMTASTCAPQADPSSGTGMRILPADPLTPLILPLAFTLESVLPGVQPSTPL